MSKAVDDLIAASAKQTTVIAGAVTAIKGFAGMVLDAKDDPVRIEQVVAQMNENADALGQAVATVPDVNSVPANPPAANVLTFSPTSGAPLSPVNLSGVDNATGATDVTLNGAPCAFTSPAPGSLVVTVPSGATTGVFVVTSPSGVQTSASSFTVTP